MKPFAESCEINKLSVLAVLKEIFTEGKQVPVSTNGSNHKIRIAGFGISKPQIS